MAKLKLNTATFYIDFFFHRAVSLGGAIEKKMLITVFLDSWLSFEALLLHTVVSILSERQFFPFFCHFVFVASRDRAPRARAPTLFVVSYFHVIERYYSIAPQQ